MYYTYLLYAYYVHCICGTGRIGILNLSFDICMQRWISRMVHNYFFLCLDEQPKGGDGIKI